MVQLGFVIDHSRCIGCHACTVACKSENDVPVGKFRTWVKYTEQGEFPAVKRSFAVLRCNQCTDAPCMSICPTSALDKRDDGIVDLDQDACIGCKSCMQACPYDALYIDEDTGTAEKCHFCAHRTEVGLAPACAVVCPTEAIVPGDFDDPESVVSRMKSSGELTARKEEAGTKPNVFYKEAAPAGLDPGLTNSAGGYLWANQVPGDPLEAERALAAAEEHAARTTYDVDHQPWWGNKVSAYLLTKSVSAGALLAALPLLNPETGRLPAPVSWAAPLLGLVFLAITGLLLVLDLKRPERFIYIFLRPNWDSWLVKGSVAITAYGALLTAMLGAEILGIELSAGLSKVLAYSAGAAALATAVYTAWLFGQAKGRVLWMKRGLAGNLAAHAAIAGATFVLPFAMFAGLGAQPVAVLLLAGLGVELFLSLSEPKLAPSGREVEYARVMRVQGSGALGQRHHLARWLLIFAVVNAAAGVFTGLGSVALIAGLVGTVAVAVSEDVFVRAGQALQIS